MQHIDFWISSDQWFRNPEAMHLTDQANQTTQKLKYETFSQSQKQANFGWFVIFNIVTSSNKCTHVLASADHNLSLRSSSDSSYFGCWGDSMIALSKIFGFYYLNFLGDNSGSWLVLLP